jgi:hypothetical protein
VPLIHRSGSTALQPRPEGYEPPSARERWRQVWRETGPGAHSELYVALRPIVAVALFAYGWVRDRRAR